MLVFCPHTIKRVILRYNARRVELVSVYSRYTRNALKRDLKPNKDICRDDLTHAFNRLLVPMPLFGSYLRCIALAYKNE